MCETKLGPIPDDAFDKVNITDFVDELVAALVTVRVYDRSHPRVRSSLQELASLHRRLLQQLDAPSLVIAQSGGFLLHEDRPLVGASMGAKKLIDPLAARQSGGIEFDRELGERDLEALLALLAGPVEDATHDLANKRMQFHGCKGIGLLPPYQRGQYQARAGAGQSLAGAGLDEQGVMLPLQLRQRIVDSLQGASISVARGGTVDLQGIQGVAQLLTDTVRKNPGEAQNMARYERYDAFTFGHSIRVCALALNFAANLTEDPRLLLRIGMAALLHDIGKSLIPFDILHHRGRLSPEQRREMERHAALGAEVLLCQSQVDDIAVTVSHGHHKNLDGSGYPNDALGIEQSTVTRLIKICDVYEALTAVRPYKGAMTPTKAYRVMLDMHGHFDLALLRQFIRINGCYPVGSEVELNDRSTARVLMQTRQLLRPVMQLERHGSGQVLHGNDRLTIDLSQPDQQQLKVARLLDIGCLQVELGAGTVPAAASG